MKITIVCSVHRVLTTKYPEIIVKWMDGSKEKLTYLQATKETGEEVKKLIAGDQIRVGFDIHSSESLSSGKWFNNLKITSLEVL